MRIDLACGRVRTRSSRVSSNVARSGTILIVVKVMSLEIGASRTNYASPSGTQASIVIGTVLPN